MQDAQVLQFLLGLEINLLESLDCFVFSEFALRHLGIQQNVQISFYLQGRRALVDSLIRDLCH